MLSCNRRVPNAHRDGAALAQLCGDAGESCLRLSLQAVLPEWTVPDMTIYALYASRKHLSPAVRALLDFLVERFAKIPWQ